MVKKGEWVQVHQIVLKPEERTARIPEDTKECPLELWVKGFLEGDGDFGEEVTIRTLTGRLVKGELVAHNPGYEYGFGEEFIPEILRIGLQLKGILKGGDTDER